MRDLWANQKHKAQNHRNMFIRFVKLYENSEKRFSIYNPNPDV